MPHLPIHQARIFSNILQEIHKLVNCSYLTSFIEYQNHGIRNARCANIDISFTTARCKPPNAVYYGGYNGFPPVDKPLYDIGTVVKFYCDEGYRIAGSYSEVKCILGSDRTAKWSRAFPVCKGIHILYQTVFIHHVVDLGVTPSI